ncbi:hypothetical protein BGZ46_004092 [Entomortierella lignicola]|nr:hypothetical protein BGZ46_004092 [Entomortierella lignicola]
MDSIGFEHTEYAIPTATSIVENSPRLGFHHNLESLKMRHVHIDQNSLEALCSALPFLLRLEVRFLRLSSSSNPGHFNRQEFYRSLARYCPRIESLHFSLFHRKLTVVDSTVLQHSFPTLKELSMAGKDLDDPSYGYRIKLLEYYANHLTKLEILCYTQIQGNQFLERLHQFLCTARHLQHLIAPKVKYWSEYLDLEEGKGVENDEDNEIYYIARNVRESQEWRIPTWRWACQDLETLHLGFTARFGSSTNAEHSRVIFGYLSRYCPNLKDLHISKNMLNLHIDGGLCLLTRLKYLERLTISSHTVYFDLIPSDINWIGYLANQILTVADTNSLDAEEVPAAKGKKNKAVNYFKSLVPIRRKKATLASSIQLVKTIEDVFAIDKKWNEKRKEHRVSTVFASQLNEYDEFLSDATSESQYRFWRHLRSFVLGVNPAHLFKDSKDGNLIQEMRPDINFKVQQWTNDT